MENLKKRPFSNYNKSGRKFPNHFFSDHVHLQPSIYETYLSEGLIQKRTNNTMYSTTQHCLKHNEKKCDHNTQFFM